MAMAKRAGGLLSLELESYRAGELESCRELVS
jgi:hypothetical protein